MILDEVGRATSTQDALPIAQAAMEHRTTSAAGPCSRHTPTSLRTRRRRCRTQCAWRWTPRRGGTGPSSAIASCRAERGDPTACRWRRWQSCRARCCAGRSSCWPSKPAKWLQAQWRQVKRLMAKLDVPSPERATDDARKARHTHARTAEFDPVWMALRWHGSS